MAIRGDNGAGILAFCTYTDSPEVRVRVNRQMTRWRCDACGNSTTPTCRHAVAVQHTIHAHRALREGE